ncbi:M4 family peptidase [Pseudonocardiaceae bacterium YIM PH 21723]|nr:M4 family peptidase [Pseudonocardiaceae bacterium YIM PH 21723]
MPYPRDLLVRQPSLPCTEGSSSMKKHSLLKAVAAAAVVATAVLGYQSPEFVNTDQVAVTSTGDVRGLIPAQPIEADQDKVTKAFKTQETDLRTVSTTEMADGSVVRQQQFIDDVPVFGGEIIQQRTKDGKLSSALGKVTKAGTDATFPAGGEEKAKEAATKVFLGKATSADKVWFDPTLADKAGESKAFPAYRVKVEGGDDSGESIVRASDNTPVLNWSLHNDALNRVVCDANKKVIDSNSQARCGTNIAASRAEGGAASGVADVNSVFGFFGDTQTLYSKINYDLTAQIGVDHGDGKGKALRGTVRLCKSTGCPWTNAQWSPSDSQMYFGEGVSTDDVTGHELTHGVTGKISKLVYSNESGAINESLSDIFGEFMDLTNGSSDDTAANRWAIGEGSSLGVIRSMSNPESKKHPGTYKGTNWYAGTGDNGGVHTNSGVGNKLAFLTVDGGTYNSQTVKGLGLDKGIQLWWKVQNLLTASSNYADLGRAINSGCTSLATAGTAGFTTADCTEVGKAVKAVKIG